MIDSIKLRELTEDDQEALSRAVSSFYDRRFEFANYFETVFQKDYHKFLEGLQQFKLGVNLPSPDHVASTQLYAFNEKNEIMGRCSFRHELNPYLKEFGGHIGYLVLPQFRGLGVGTKILDLTKVYLRKEHPKIEKILVTCDEDNHASIKIIVSNGGVLENKISQGYEKPLKNRYWISL